MNIGGILRQLQISNTAAIMDLLKNFEVGDTIRVRVMEVSDRELVLRLPDGRIINAAAMNETGAEKGGILQLKINGKSDRQLFMEIISPDIAEIAGIRKEAQPVKEAALAVPAQIVSEIAAKFKTSPEIAAFIAANGIEPAQENINLVKQLDEGWLKIGSQLKEIIGLLGQAASGRTTDAAIESITKFTAQLESIFIDPDSDTLSEKLDVKSKYSDILTRLTEIKGALKELPVESSLLSDSIDRLENGMKLLSHLEEQNTYLQIPISIQNERTTGELYIMKRNGSRKRIDPGSISMLISLDTFNLGLVETLVKIDSKNISLSLRAENKDIVDFFKENYSLLYESLNKAGYKVVDMRYKVIEGRSGVTSSEKKLRREFGDIRGSFDFRI